VVGTNGALISLVGYAEFVMERSDTIRDETQMIAAVNEIRETSLDALVEMEMLKLSLDRFLFSQDDIGDPLEEFAERQRVESEPPSLFARIRSMFAPRSSNGNTPRLMRFRDMNDTVNMPLYAKNNVLIDDDDTGDDNA